MVTKEKSSAYHVISYNLCSQTHNKIYWNFRGKESNMDMNSQFSLWPLFHQGYKKLLHCKRRPISTSCLPSLASGPSLSKDWRNEPFGTQVHPFSLNLQGYILFSPSTCSAGHCSTTTLDWVNAHETLALCKL